MLAILNKISSALDLYEQSWGYRPRHVVLPLGDAQDLAAFDSSDSECLDDSVDDLDEQELLLGPEGLEGTEMFGVVIHVDPKATVITCR